MSGEIETTGAQEGDDVASDEFAGYGEALAVGETAPDLTLRDETGAEVALASLWRERGAVIVFIRHFG